MREKRHVGNLQSAEQLDRRHQPAPAVVPVTLTAAMRCTPRAGLVVGGLRGFTGM